MWAYFDWLKLDFSRLGKPTDNAVIESFNGRPYDERMNQPWFLSIDEARAVRAARTKDYTCGASHGIRGHRTASELARRWVSMPVYPSSMATALGWYQVRGGFISMNYSSGGNTVSGGASQSAGPTASDLVV